MKKTNTMTRPIKFRAWSGNMLLDGNDANIHPKNPDNTDIELEAGHHRPILLEQFTGLLDKNGVEIYEGDVVSYTYVSGFDAEDDYKGYTEPNRKGVVKFREGAFYPIPDASIPEDGYYGWRHWNFEVIGNIHENPELLK